MTGLEADIQQGSTSGSSTGSWGQSRKTSGLLRISGGGNRRRGITYRTLLETFDRIRNECESYDDLIYFSLLKNGECGRTRVLYRLVIS